jgi:two-component system chemotaxis response regulator CheB
MTPERSIRVLVVDDSAFARKVLRESLSLSPDIEVVGTARDGLEALEKIAELRPDVVTLDLVMPNLDGLGVLRALALTHQEKEGPRVIVVSISDSESALGVEALQTGAIDLVHKPTALATDRLYELAAELGAKVRAAARSKNPWPASALAKLESRDRRPSRPGSAAVTTRLVVIGTSTGGPQALTRLLAALPGDFPCAVAVALHIPAGYTDALARRLDESCAVSVFEAYEGAELKPGSVAIARGGVHLRVTERDGEIFARVDPNPLTAPHSPSVDELFRSAAAAVGSAVLGVVLTGMGSDGLEGARAIRGAGGRILTESEGSCVVFGMPRVVLEAGLSTEQSSVDDMVNAILRNL